MENELKKTTLSRILLACMFSGFFTAIAVVLFTYFYRENTGFEKYTAINPGLVFIGIPILQVIAGVIYLLLLRYVKWGEFLFITLIVVLLITGIVSNMNLGSTDGKSLLTTPHGLLFGMILITSLSLGAFLPFLVHHPHIYMTDDELNW